MAGAAGAACLGKGVRCGAARAGATSASPNGRSLRLRRRLPGAASSSSGGTGSDGPFFPVFSALMSCHRTRRAIDSAS